jgi:hypothetical protein
MLSIVRAGRGFRMVLDRHYWQCAMAHAFDALVVWVYVRDFDFRWQRVGLQRKAVGAESNRLRSERVNELFDCDVSLS